MLRIKIKIALIALYIIPFWVYSQTQVGKAPINWYNMDYKTDQVMGISTEKAYPLLKGKSPVPVIVAVIDGGVDIHHQDLKNVLWINENEKQKNGIDNDSNGYVNDTYGWNFIGNSNGENVHYDNLEVTRLIKEYEPKYISVLPSTKLSAKERAEFVAFQKMITDYTNQMDEAQFGEINYNRLKQNLDKILSSTTKTAQNITKKDIDTFKATSEAEKLTLRLAKKEIEKGNFPTFYNEIAEATEYFSTQTKYHLNKNYDSRNIVGDDYKDAYQRFYGNNDVIGPDAEHGTHVAGIIAADRKNDLGVNGVADNVKIMTIRVVPNGDERDKDVANGIRYAVDNGAKVINMSFGKSYSYNKKVVEDAIKYALHKDVLLIHAAGNDGKDLDIYPNYPNKYFTDSLNTITGEASNWITVGATGPKIGDDLLATFSNYGYKTVDVFAPGVDIYSTTPNNQYKYQDGTSMAAPVVTGLAALLRSYYPELTAQEIKQIILNSVTKVDQKVKVKKDGTTKKVYLDEISVSGGIANAYNAIIEANKYLTNKSKQNN